jgi:predicted acyltransferase (DUF342 family)
MLERLVIPRKTKFDERTLIVEGDALIGAYSKIGYGINARKVVIGDKAEIHGRVLGEEEVRLGAWTIVKGDVISKGDAYIGEFSLIEGRLTVHGDLEIGKNVRLKGGFEAKGMITVQNPVPILIFIFLYILELLRLGKIEEIEKLFEIEDFVSPLEIPENSIVNIDVIKTEKDVFMEDSRVLGNIKAKNVTAKGCEVYGSIRGVEIVVENTRVHGAIEGKTVYLIKNSTVLGHIKADRVIIEEGCTVEEGSVFGKEGVWVKDVVDLSDVHHNEG